MGTLGTTGLTLSDYRKRMAPDGSVDFIIEALEQGNPMLQHVKWNEGNLPTGNKTSVRVSIPTPSIRLINRGVANHKSTTKQITDTCMMLEDRSTVDVKLLRLSSDPQGLRRSEDAAFVMGFSDTVVKNLMYGDADKNPETFNGFSIRYDVIGGEKGEAGYQVIAGGTAGTGTNTSAFFVGWGSKHTVGIYPRGSKMGLTQEDLGEMDVNDANGNPYRALVTLFDWDCGLAVQDIRSNAAVRNIDVSKVMGLSSTDKKALVDKFIIAKNRIRNLQNKDKDVHLYVSDTMYDFFETYLLDKNNVHVTRQDLQGAPTQLYLSGIPIDKCDVIMETEPAFTVA